MLNRNTHIASITENILADNDYSVSETDARKLAALPDSETIDLLSGANRIRSRFFGNDIFTCTIVNAKSGRCSEDCAFCAQSGHYRTEANIYPLMTRGELIDRALEMDDAGVTHYSMVTSGFRLTDAEIDTLCEVAAEVRQRTGLTVCCSIGVLNRKQAEKLVQSGVKNYHHNLETAESHFPEICTTHTYAEDIASIQTAAEAGLSICSGGIMGLGESWDQRIELAITLRELDVAKIPLNFINPVSGTKMADRPLLHAMTALKCIALFRFIHPKRHITICGGRDVTLKDFQSWIFFAGATGVMTGNYLTTTGRDIVKDKQMIAAWQTAGQ